MLAHTGFAANRFFLKLIKLLMLLTLNKNHTILQMSGRVGFLFCFFLMKDVGTKGRCSHLFALHCFNKGRGENFKLKLNWPFPIEAAGILLNERLVRCVLVSSPLACVVPENASG